jgi:allantoinase
MTVRELVIRGKQVVLPSGIGPASIHVVGEKIVSIATYDEVLPDGELVEIDDDAIVMPGLVDTHVHVNEPGRTEWEGFETATRAAAAGGVTTIVDMPLNSIPPTTTIAGLEAKVASATGKTSVDVGFWGGVVPGNTAELAKLWDAGVVGFKCFLIHSGVDEFPNVSEGDLREAMPELMRLGAGLIVHAELPGPIERTGVVCGTASATDEDVCSKYDTFLRSRPRAAENEAVELMIRLAREFNTRVHIVHHSSSDALQKLREARQTGVNITVETCPHYLYFAAEEIPDGATEFKCCPPIRERENREELWRALEDGTIVMVVSDHSPCPPELKLRDRGDFLAAWGGISSLQLRLPIVWTMAKARGVSVNQMATWLCSAPAKLVGLEKIKGSIAEGLDADLVIWNPAKEFKVDSRLLHHRHKLSPYNEELLYGNVEQTFLRGAKIYDAGNFIERGGNFLTRNGH